MRKKAKTILIILILTAAALTAAASYFLYSFYVPDEQAEVLGNIRYTDAEIRRMAMPGFKEHNSLYLRYLRKEIELTDVPFIDSIEVEYLSPNRVRLHANEEYPVGYFLQDGYRLYFNSSGIVTESLEDASMRKEEEEQKEEKERDETEEIMAEGALQEPETGAESDTAFRPALTDVSQVSGLTEKPYAVGEQIQTDNTEIFGTLMTLGKLVNKLDIRPDEILIEEDETIALRYGEILVDIGKDTLLDEKMSRAAAILPQLEGMKGTLHLENFTMSTINIIFSAYQEEMPEEDTDNDDAYAQDESYDELYIEDGSYDEMYAQDVYYDGTYVQDEYSEEAYYPEEIYGY